MHPFSPFRFDLAKQMPLAVPEMSQSQAYYASATLRKTCARLEILSCHTVWRFGARMGAEFMQRFGTIHPGETPYIRPSIQPRNCAVELYYTPDSKPGVSFLTSFVGRVNLLFACCYGSASRADTANLSPL
jgi:hypothetical protein